LRLAIADCENVLGWRQATREGGREGGAVVERRQRKTKRGKHWSCATTPNTGAGLAASVLDE